MEINLYHSADEVGSSKTTLKQLTEQIYQLQHIVHEKETTIRKNDIGFSVKVIVN